jgi:hypothetical protein
VLNNGDDQVAVKVILKNLLSDDLKDEVVILYNKHVTIYNDMVASMQRPTEKPLD